MMLSKFIAVTAFMLVASASALAQTKGAYAGLSVGQLKSQLSCLPGLPCDKSATTVKAYGGYRFSFGLGLEGGVTSYGATTGLLGNFGSNEIKATSLWLGPAYYVDVSPAFTLGLHAGVASVNTSARPYFFGVKSDREVSDRFFRPYAGISAYYKVSESVAAQVSFDAVRGEIFDQPVTLNSLFVGMRLNF
jgi:Outer membrane protein beta-barrel domain